MFNINSFKSNKSLKLALCWTIFISSILYFIWKIIFMGVPQYDFHIFYFAFDKVFHHDKINLLYDHHNLVIGMNRLGYSVVEATKNFYGYPPQFAVLFSPFSLMGYKISKWIWFFLSDILYFAGIILFIKIAYKGKSFGAKLIIIAFSLANGALYYDIFWGQSNRMIFFLIALTFYLVYIKKFYWLAGIPMSLAIVFKVTPILIVGLFVIRRNWKTVNATIIASIFFTTVTMFFTGYNLIWKYCTQYLWSLNKLNMENGNAPWNSSFKSVLKSCINNIQIEKILPLIFILVIVTASFITMTKAKQNMASFDIGIFTLLVLLLSPTIEVHHLVLAMFAEVAILARTIEQIEKGFKKKISAVQKISYLSIVLIIVLSILPVMFISYFVILVLCFINIIYLYNQIQGKCDENENKCV